MAGVGTGAMWFSRDTPPIDTGANKYASVNVLAAYYLIGRHSPGSGRCHIMGAKDDTIERDGRTCVGVIAIAFGLTLLFYYTSVGWLRGYMVQFGEGRWGVLLLWSLLIGSLTLGMALLVVHRQRRQMP